jgi:hypothetical protein
MTPAEAARSLEGVRNPGSPRARLRLVGAVDNPEAEGPGARLQAARHAAGLSVVQVASALRLKPHQVAAIEALHFTKLPGLGYALGYVRAYGELMELSDVDGLVDAFRDAWAPQQKRREAELNRGSSAAMAPVGAIVALGALAWLLIWAALHGAAPRKADPIAPPEASIKTWADAAPATPGRPVVTVEPASVLKALRETRVSLRGEDGALVVDRTLREGEEISTEGLGRWFVSSPDGGALEARGYGETVKVGLDGVKVESWRVPDLAAIAAAKSAEAAKLAAEAAAVAAAKEAAKNPPAPTGSPAL